MFDRNVKLQFNKMKYAPMTAKSIISFNFYVTRIIYIYSINFLYTELDHYFLC